MSKFKEYAQWLQDHIPMGILDELMHHTGPGHPYGIFIKDRICRWVDEAKKECMIPEMPFIPPYAIEQSNLPKANELSEWIRKVHQTKVNLEKWLGKPEQIGDVAKW